MTVRIAAKDTKLPEDVLLSIEKKLHQRLDSYYRNERAEDESGSILTVKISERKRQFKVEINMPYGGQLLRTENEERDNVMPALDKGIDVLERQVKKHKTRMALTTLFSLTFILSVGAVDIMFLLTLGWDR